MANLHIRNVPESVRRGLRLRAARKGNSVEAEVRAILAETVRGETGKAFDPDSLQDFILGLFKGKPPRLTDELIQERRREAAEESRSEAERVRSRRANNSRKAVSSKHSGARTK